MSREEALRILRAHQEWRRYDGPLGEGPEMQDPVSIGQAIDVAIHELEIHCQESPKKEYYGM